MAAVTIKNVWKYYGKTVAVRDLTLDCADNSFLCILGPSGCGKSSTLRMLAGLEHISAGDIYFDGKRVNDLPPKARDIAMVFENYALYPHKTVYENIANPLRLRNINGAAADAKVRKVATLLEIENLLDRKPAQLSGGQKQRVAIGRAIVRQPRLFLFDEPIAHLDAKLRAHMRGELKHLQRELKTTTIYVTHDQMEALSMADMVAVMHQGVLQQLGTPDEIYNHPANEWVAGFVGEPPMNFLDCRIEEADGQLFATAPDMRVALTAEQAARLRKAEAPRDLRLGIRPDDLTVSLDAGRANDGFTGEVFIVEPVGGDTLVYVKLVGEERLLVRTRMGFRAESGTPCAVSVNAARLHLFAPDTGVAYF
ncbi:MAG: ABC transporter ATP-binding protein [Rhodospirillaceae bacterium]|nr:ABC transporter ATP-binding protein [Rhodospirillaceae bacterium]